MCRLWWLRVRLTCLWRIGPPTRWSVLLFGATSDGKQHGRVPSLSAVNAGQCDDSAGFVLEAHPDQPERRCNERQQGQQHERGKQEQPDSRQAWCGRGGVPSFAR